MQERNHPHHRAGGGAQLEQRRRKTTTGTIDDNRRKKKSTAFSKIIGRFPAVVSPTTRRVIINRAVVLFVRSFVIRLFQKKRTTSGD